MVLRLSRNTGKIAPLIAIDQFSETLKVRHKTDADPLAGMIAAEVVLKPGASARIGFY